MNRESNNTGEPPLIPEIPEPLREAADQGKLVIFVGAGVSRLKSVGGPSWEQFANQALRKLAADEHLNFAELTQLESLPPKIKLSIATNICEEHRNETDFFREILQPVAHEEPPQVYRDLYSIGAVYVTTNYDEWLDLAAEESLHTSRRVETEAITHPEEVASEPKKPKVFYKPPDLTIEKLDKPGTVLHLHGSVTEPDTMIITTRQYLEHYQDETVMTFLDRLFKTYSVLFVGYGLDEEEILERILRKRDAQQGGKDPKIKHYWLFPRFSYQDNLFTHLFRYYQSHCEVELIDYCIDRQGYDQLIDVIKAWANQLKVREPDYLTKIKVIDEAPDE